MGIAASFDPVVSTKKESVDATDIESVAATEKPSPEPETSPQREAAPGLSDRDRRILERHQAGASKRGIARELGISEGTLRNVLERLGIDKRQ
ncbi:LuxR C-terminal-related transcriptional regulator [Thiorhodococcus minor]|uniref:HTH luxR-type domain-containing protein n=1 Tax=Thiorhodococcus minor TaxID=57489 RepID=A0A6M0JZZ4_9GAMM|nr:LuxR C-terminal-related transcriptional regulator [Thiorhodococcus minor]NEV62253.1 hypothetical protein [Thiorhodococcus minor]